MGRWLTTARKQLISIEATTYYHCVSRCVRRSFLCGEDKQNQVSYEHRREWIVNKMNSLSNLYCIDICAYAIMSNHYHLVVNINQTKAMTLSDHEVVERWGIAHKLPLIIQRWLQVNSQRSNSSAKLLRFGVSVMEFELVYEVN